MIEPLARGVDPVQLAFQSLVNMGTRTQRAESPLAVALDRLGVDLARGEPFTTAEAKQFVSLVQATLEVFETATAVPAAPPAPGAVALPAQSTGAGLETAQFAMRDLQRALTQVLTEHRQVTTSLAPILRALLLAEAVETLAPAAHAFVPARFMPLVPQPRSVAIHEPVPTLARLVSSLVESIARLQAVLPLDAVPLAEGLTAPEHIPAAAPPAAAEHASPAAAPPPATTRLLQTLVEALADVVTLLPLADSAVASGGPLAAQPATAVLAVESLVRALKDAVALLRDVLPATATPVPIEPSRVPADAARVPATAQSLPLPSATRLGSARTAAQSSPPPSAARLGGAVVQAIRLVHELLLPNPTAESGTSAAELRLPVVASHSAASRSPAASQVEVSHAPVANQAEGSRSPVASHTEPTQVSAPTLSAVPPPVAAGLAGIPASLVASLLAVVTNLKAGLPPATAADDSAALVTGTLLAELEAASVINPGLAGASIPLSAQVATVDAYRWGLLVGLNYRPALGRPVQAPISSGARPRCETCSRLLVQTRSGALVCPTCSS